MDVIELTGRLKKAFNIKISPTVLISHGTISDLSEYIEGIEGFQHSDLLVPMKSSGSQRPLFCIHSGGAHVLFYKGLGKYIHEDRPVYAIEPSHLDDDQINVKTIDQMAEQYISEIKKIQKSGPYFLLGTCFSNAVILEMAHQLKSVGEEIGCLYVIDSAPAYLTPPSPNGERKPVARMLEMVRSRNWNGISRKLNNRLTTLTRRSVHRSHAQIELNGVIDALNDMYVKYTWKPIECPIVLIRSSEFSSRSNKDFHLTRWNTLSCDSLSVREVPGHHLTLFEEPEVRGLAQSISDDLKVRESGLIEV